MIHQTLRFSLPQNKTLKVVKREETGKFSLIKSWNFGSNEPHTCRYNKFGVVGECFINLKAAICCKVCNEM